MILNGGKSVNNWYKFLATLNRFCCFWWRKWEKVTHFTCCQQSLSFHDLGLLYHVIKTKNNWKSYEQDSIFWRVGWIRSVVILRLMLQLLLHELDTIHPGWQRHQCLLLILTTCNKDIFLSFSNTKKAIELKCNYCSPGFGDPDAAGIRKISGSDQQSVVCGQSLILSWIQSFWISLRVW